MESLANYYRPLYLHDVIAQEPVTDVLERQLATGMIKNVYLFCGASGCGKTTIGRAFARAINNDTRNLSAIYGVIEIDAASNNGVDNIRMIIDTANERSLDGEYKIIILDEAHMLSTAAWNALLKTLEEPPKYTIFMLCTTNPEKIPATILNRVQRFNLQRIPAKQIEQRLLYICEQERFINYNEACAYIAKISNGQMRDAIASLDKCRTYSTDLNMENVLYCLGNFSYQTFFTLTNAIIDGDLASALSCINDIYLGGKDLTLFINSFFTFILDVSKYLIFKSFDIIEIPAIYESEINNIVNLDGATEFYTYLIDKLFELKQLLKNETNIHSVVEASIMKMVRMI